MTMSGTTSDATSGNEWQRMTWQQMSDHQYSFRLISLFLDNKQPKENSLNLEEDLEEGQLN